jgi:TIR domain
MNVFISWSGTRSKQVAIVLKKWLKDIIQNLEPWMSDTDIQAGQRGINEIFTQLKKSSIGIICVTPENMSEPWLCFEAGALSNAVSNKSKVCPVLLDIEPTQVTGPLSEFQCVKSRSKGQPNKDGLKKLIKSIYLSMEKPNISEDKLNTYFEKWWDDLEADFKNISTECPTSPTPRDPADIAKESLELLRRIDRKISSPTERLKIRMPPNILTNSSGSLPSFAEIGVTPDGFRFVDYGDFYNNKPISRSNETELVEFKCEPELLESGQLSSESKSKE